MNSFCVYREPRPGHQHYVVVDGTLVGYVSAGIAGLLTRQERAAGRQVDTGRSRAPAHRTPPEREAGS